MSLGWVITGTISQLMLGFYLFMFTAFSGVSIVNENELSKFHVAVLNFSMIALPCSCLLSAGIVLYLYKTDASTLSYWWYVTPLLLVALYIAFALRVYK
jgi:hypothetical protein